MRWSTWGYVALSFVVHGSVGAAMARLPKPVIKKSMMVAVASKKREDKKEDKKLDEPPPPPAPPKPVKRAPAPPKATVENTPPPPLTAPKAVAAANPVLAALPNLGISLAGGPGGGGIAVPIGPVHDAPAANGANGNEGVHTALKPKEPDCSEALVKPKLQGAIQQPTFTEAARAAGVEGKIRVEVQVDTGGNVTSARVVSGLGYGLDEAAMAVAKRMKFAPGSRCGKPVAATFLFSYRFALE